MVFTGAGYFLGVHAPGRIGLTNFLAAAHQAALCQAEGGRIVRSMLPESIVGTAFSCSYIEPFRFIKPDMQAATRVDALLNRMFAEPLAGLGYPVKDLKLLQRLERYGFYRRSELYERNSRVVTFYPHYLGLLRTN